MDIDQASKQIKAIKNKKTNQRDTRSKSSKHTNSEENRTSRNADESTKKGICQAKSKDQK